MLSLICLKAFVAAWSNLANLLSLTKFWIVIALCLSCNYDGFAFICFCNN
jgi:hypothetical protein